MRTAVASVAALVVLAGVGGAAGVTDRPAKQEPARRAVPAVPDSRSAEQRAMAAATASGRPVEVLSARSETRQVFAEPTGRFRMELSAKPVRVRKGADWVAPDTTLRAVPDGTVVPAAAGRSVVFSGGGSATPLVRLADGDWRMELRWPDPLPAPALSGDTATYPDVFPGVDLRLRALVQGFSEVLVVRTRQAARDPRLSRIRFGLATAGLTLAMNGHGGVAAKDAAGTEVFSSSKVEMWDSPPQTANPGRAAESPPVGERHAVGRVELSAGQLAVIPDQRLLADPAAVYPVFIDPSYGPGYLGWTKVFSGKPNNNYWMGGVDDNLGKVGQCYNANGDCNGIGAARTFFQFDISGLRSGSRTATIYDLSKFSVHGIHAPSCTRRLYEFWQVGPVDTRTTWNNQPGGWWGPLGGHDVGFGRSGCPADWVGINARQTITNRLNDGSNVATFAVRAADEGDQLAWRKFDNVALTVEYNWPPDMPVNVWANADQGPSLGCAGSVDQAFVYSPRPTLHAVLTDRDGQNLEANFEWRRAGETAIVGYSRPLPPVFQPNGTELKATIPAAAFADGSKIQWRVRAGDNIVWGEWSRWCNLTVDQTPPGRPGVASTDYPEDQVAGYLGRTGAFTVTSSASDVLGFQWSLNFQDLPIVDVNSPFFVRASNGTATIRVTPTRDGPNVLYVRAVDRALNVSPVYQKPDGNGGWVPGGYHFTVGSAAPPAVGYWPLDGKHLTTKAPDASGRGHDGTVVGIHPAGGAAWDAGRVGDALRFNGSSGYVATGGGRVVDTASTFSVSAWVRLDAVDGVNRAAVSQDGDRVYGFFLGYVSDQRRFTFRMVPADSETVPTVRAVSNAPPTAGVWTHLVGTYDVATKQMRLYVNGAPHGTATLNTPWSTPTGAVQIGRAKYNRVYTDHWLGPVDEVQVFNRLLGDSEIQSLANTPTVEQAFYPFDDGTGTGAADVSGNYRMGTLTGGASWVPGPVGTSAVRLDGVNDAVTTTQQAVRTDASFTVTARARLDAANGTFQTVVSQDGPSSSGFALQYTPATRSWVFALSPADAANPAWLTVRSAGSAQPAEYVHLAGVYDAAKGEVRLYVNGVEHIAPARVNAHVPGNLVIGRAKQTGVGGPVAYFGGRIDDVHVYTGVRTKEQIVADNVNPVTGRSTIYTGQLSRYSNHAWRHYVTTGPVPPDYHFEYSLGLMAPQGTPNTTMLFSCQYSGGQFTSLSSTCEGYTRLGEIGLLYTTAPAGVPTIAIYRCMVPSTGNHFVSTDVNCEGVVNEGRQGYTLGYRKLIRYVKEYPPHDHWTTVVGPTAGYRPESAHGVVAMTGESNTRPLMSCVDSVDEFVSTDPGCEGKTVRYWIGGVWIDPPEYALESRLLYSCRVTPSGERFTSLDELCEGRTVVGPLGYVITRL